LVKKNAIYYKKEVSLKRTELLLSLQPWGGERKKFEADKEKGRGKRKRGGEENPKKTSKINPS